MTNNIPSQGPEEEKQTTETIQHPDERATPVQEEHATTTPTTPTPEEQEPPKTKKSFSYEAFKKRVESNKNFDYLLRYAKSNTIDLFAYVVVVIGVMLLFFQPFYGTLLIGLVAGRYFAAEVLFVATHLNELVEEHGIVKSLVLGAVLLALLFSAPGIFLGMALMVAIRLFVLPDQ